MVSAWQIEMRMRAEEFYGNRRKFGKFRIEAPSCFQYHRYHELYIGLLHCIAVIINYATG